MTEPFFLATQLRPGWDEYFLAITKTVALRADCLRRKVGAVLVDQDHRILATGYNGTYPGGPSCLLGQCPRGRKSYEEQPPLQGNYDECISTHAEANALLFARASCKGATVYITDPPCNGCRKLLLSAGVKRIVWSDEEGKVHSNG